ncbi:polyphosphate kinase 2, PA0141 family [Saccharicrinis carchari]|uniref:ADP/GDP-polyphosphate phosphotransferase n=1 Tax=Saccharicrinis carchari TaxID=1168039 RepID=A0A521EEH3_SACCC|nr:polyphosphate kinase 2 [Saccharicrinis carchari]SMO81570.1 polyphosphate kinase 2, PA0141 family [Saccharicrinis carchari]
MMRYHSIENDPEYINLQTELIKLQYDIIEKKERLLIIFEGRDSAGKGGAIMRFIRFLNPRFYRVVALTKPTDIERRQWYFQRYIENLPNPGEIVFFDRSWYNRAVVEPVMGFCTPEQYKLFLKQVVSLENMLVEDGLKIVKLWFSIDPEEQKRRLEERKINPLIQWKLSTVDMQAQLKWDDYTYYKNKMFKHTGTPESPWVSVKGNNKDYARKEAMRYVLNSMSYAKKDKISTKDFITLVGQESNNYINITYYEQGIKITDYCSSNRLYSGMHNP